MDCVCIGPPVPELPGTCKYVILLFQHLSHNIQYQIIPKAIFHATPYLFQRNRINGTAHCNTVFQWYLPGSGFLSGKSPAGLTQTGAARHDFQISFRIASTQYRISICFRIISLEQMGFLSQKLPFYHGNMPQTRDICLLWNNFPDWTDVTGLKGLFQTDYLL